MKNITINNSTVFINYNDGTVSEAKDKLLTKLYYARNKNTMGGHDAWLKLLDMYYACNFEGMQRFIKSCHGKGGKTRNECIKYLDIIIGGTN